MTQNHVTETLEKSKKVVKTKKLAIFFNEAGQNLVESVQNTISGNLYYLILF